MFTEILNKKLTAHIGNTWNYGIQFGKEKCRVFRYYTNGSNNSNYEYKSWVTIENMQNIVGEDRWDSIDYLDQESYGNRKFVEEASELLEYIFNVKF